MKKSLILIIMLLVLIPNTFAFSIFGFDLGAIFGFNRGYFQVETIPVPINQSNLILENITLDGTTYTSADLVSKVNNKENMDEYIKGFNYNCVGVETTQGKSFTMIFDTSVGKLNGIYNGIICPRSITIDETLITDFKENGFQIGNVKEYLGKVDLESTMYLKALKVFTIG